ncbi:F0F1 ATP synthase subunit B family protein [Roseibium marinum]|uniref:ATP synthase subunit b n=1 Tax=Roseibium marinum TaxID=281252 RepID=A0A2S3V486_9HYPH|nr:ATP F0F1 synthase subunit B [Roseibium marinum]POF34758.1 F-type H+-transporting ATPase subunit b [Roseibium marinum]
MDATFWAAVGLVLFFVLIIYIKVPAKIGASLDDRAEAIRKELDEARKMRDEAQALLSEYQRKRHEAEGEAEAIIAEASSEAERLTVETNQALEEMIARRTRAAEEKIAQAETQAIAEVRARAADLAVAAAEEILTAKVKDKVADDILSKSIAQVKERLN